MKPSPPGRTILCCMLLLTLVAATPAGRAPRAGEAAILDPDAIRAAAPTAPGEREVEEMSDLEMARLAKGSPDQHPGGMVFQAQLAALAALNWSFLGPRPILKEYWSGNAAASGRVSAIAVDPRNASVAYLAAAQGGIWKTVDGGVTWVPLTDQLSSLASGALAFDPINADILYYGTGEQHYSSDSFYGDGLFRTSDAGANWTKIALKASVGSYIARVAVKPTDRNLIYVASDLGVARSADGGATWAVTLAGDHCNDLAIDPVTPSTVYAAIRNVGMFKSVDDGVTWTPLGGGLPTTGFKRINFALSRSSPNVLYASFVDGTSASYGALLGMYRSSNGGATWTRLDATPDYLKDPVYGTGQGWYDNCVIVDPTDPNICYACGRFPYYGFGIDFGTIKTVNGGASWTDITTSKGGQLHPDQHFMTFGPDRTLWVATDGGVWKRTNGGTKWINCNQDLELTQLYTTANHPTNAAFLIGGTQDNGSVRYAGSLGWSQLNVGDGGPVAVEWDSPDVYYSTYVYFLNLYKWTANHGGKEVTGPWTSDRASWANGPLVINPNAPNTVLVGTHRIWRSPNSGVSWSTDNHDLTGNAGYLLSLAVAKGNSNVMASGSNQGRVFVTADGGATWAERDDGLGRKKIPDLIIDPSNTQHIYLCADTSYDDRVFVTSDAGVTWTSITGNLPAGVRALSLAVDFRASPHRLYLGTDYGVYVSSDGGVGWVRNSTGLPNCAVYDLALDTANNRLAAATHGRGEWSSPIDTAAPMIALAAPSGHEVWRVGTTHEILWDARDAAGVEAVLILLSTDGGATYSRTLASGIPNRGRYAWTVTGEAASTCRVKVIADDPSGNHGVTVSEADFVLADDTDPAATLGSTDGFALRPVVPNPGSPPLTIGFELPRRARVALEVFDVLGRRVRVLDEGLREAGSYSFDWDGGDAAGHPVSNGIYLYRLRADRFERVRRVAMLR